MLPAYRKARSRARHSGLLRDRPQGARTRRCRRLDWWRGFGSRELTLLMEEAQTANLDIAAAVARILQADAQVRIANAALLPVLDANFTATRSRTPTLAQRRWRRPRRRSPVSSLYNLNLTRELHARFLGPQSRDAAGDGRDRDRDPLRQGGDRAHHPGRASPTPIFWCSIRRTGCSIARENVTAASRILELIVQRTTGRHRVAARGLPAGKPGRDPARLDSRRSRSRCARA